MAGDDLFLSVRVGELLGEVGRPRGHASRESAVSPAPDRSGPPPGDRVREGKVTGPGSAEAWPFEVCAASLGSVCAGVRGKLLIAPWWSPSSQLQLQLQLRVLKVGFLLHGHARDIAVFWLASR
jgi:hypothetical protein